MNYRWSIAPNATLLEEKSNWAKLDSNRFAALRHIILIVEQDPVIKKGPVVKQMDWPVDAEFEYTDRKKNVITHTIVLNESISRTITQQLSTELISKVSASVGSQEILKAALSAELQKKVNHHLSESLTQSLSNTRTFQYQEEKETTEKLKFKMPKGTNEKDTRSIIVYNQVKELRWDVYLYQTDYLQLEYQKNWFWRDIRKTIIEDHATIKANLFSIVFYEPIPDFSYAYDNYSPEVSNVEEIKIDLPSADCPNKSVLELPPMTELAKLAFPITKEEKKQVKTKKISVKKAAAKKGAAKKAAAKSVGRAGISRASKEGLANKRVYGSVKTSRTKKNASKGLAKKTRSKKNTHAKSGSKKSSGLRRGGMR